jgi:hypothetical protein
MTEPANMEPKADAAKKRRDYVWRTAVFELRVKVFTNLAVGLWVITVLACPLDLVLLVRAAVPGYPASWLSASIWTTLTLFCGAGGYAYTRMAEASRCSARTLKYIPPVAEQLAALPAKEILVRGSDQPALAPDELLRAAREGEATEARELMRASQAQKSRL